MGVARWRLVWLAYVFTDRLTWTITRCELDRVLCKGEGHGGGLLPKRRMMPAVNAKRPVVGKLAMVSESRSLGTHQR